jgi:hypothetical protein
MTQPPANPLFANAVKAAGLVLPAASGSHLNSYDITFEEYVGAGSAQKTITLLAEVVEMDGEYVRLKRHGVGMVFAVPACRFVSITLNDPPSPLQPA